MFTVGPRRMLNPFPDVSAPSATPNAFASDRSQDAATTSAFGNAVAPGADILTPFGPSVGARPGMPSRGIPDAPLAASEIFSSRVICARSVFARSTGDERWAARASPGVMRKKPATAIPIAPTSVAMAKFVPHADRVGNEKELRSAEDVFGRRDEDAGAAGLAPDATIDALRLGPAVVAGMELPLVDHQLAVQQMQLLDSGMAVGRIVGSRRQPYEHADAMVFRIRREQLDRDAGRHFFPFRFRRPSWRR